MKFLKQLKMYTNPVDHIFYLYFKLKKNKKMHLSYCPKSPFNVTAYMYPKTFRLYLYDIIYDMKKERKNGKIYCVSKSEKE